MSEQMTRVKPSAEYYEQFPDVARGHGSIKSLDGEIAKVLWDGMGVPEEIHISFLTEADNRFVPVESRRSKARSDARYEAIVARRKKIRAAFDIIRHDPAQKKLADDMAGALSGRKPITADLMARVQEINRLHLH